MRQKYTPEQKAAVLARLLEGASPTELAAEFDIPRTTIGEWRRVSTPSSSLSSSSSSSLSSSSSSTSSSSTSSPSPLPDPKSQPTGVSSTQLLELKQRLEVLERWVEQQQKLETKRREQADYELECEGAKPQPRLKFV